MEHFPSRDHSADDEISVAVSGRVSDRLYARQFKMIDYVHTPHLHFPVDVPITCLHVVSGQLHPTAPAVSTFHSEGPPLPIVFHLPPFFSYSPIACLCCSNRMGSWGDTGTASQLGRYRYRLSVGEIQAPPLTWGDTGTASHLTLNAQAASESTHLLSHVISCMSCQWVCRASPSSTTCTA